MERCSIRRPPEVGQEFAEREVRADCRHAQHARHDSRSKFGIREISVSRNTSPARLPTYLGHPGRPPAISGTREVHHHPAGGSILVTLIGCHSCRPAQCARGSFQPRHAKVMKIRCYNNVVAACRIFPRCFNRRHLTKNDPRIEYRALVFFEREGDGTTSRLSRIGRESVGQERRLSMLMRL